MIAKIEYESEILGQTRIDHFTPMFSDLKSLYSGYETMRLSEVAADKYTPSKYKDH